MCVCHKKLFEEYRPQRAKKKLSATISEISELKCLSTFISDLSFGSVETTLQACFAIGEFKGLRQSTSPRVMSPRGFRQG